MNRIILQFTKQTVEFSFILTTNTVRIQFLHERDTESNLLLFNYKQDLVYCSYLFLFFNVCFFLACMIHRDCIPKVKKKTNLLLLFFYSGIAQGIETSYI